MARRIKIEPLTRGAFAPFGDVIDDTGDVSFATNGGAALRIHALGVADCNAEGGKTLLSLFRMAQPSLPTGLHLMERHPLSSQAFVPLGSLRMIVVVAAADTIAAPGDLRAFASNGRQGVNYRKATWHHPLIALDAGDFLVVDRAGPRPGLSPDAFDQDYEEVPLPGGIQLDFGGMPPVSSSPAEWERP
ncbi:ureidoglycolate lyase [Mesorhizobium loti]|nr:ureidoglycolate lyase [Mesorhizobium loti]